MKFTIKDVHKCLIVVGGFLCYFVADGCTYSFGVIYGHALDYFGVSNYETAWMNALLYAVPQLLSPLVCSLGVAFGTSTLAFVGSILIFLALLLIAFSTAIWQVYLSIALLMGFGLESTYVAALFSVSNSFDKHRGAAIGFATSGSGLGGLSLSTLTTFLFSIYEWKETCALLAAIALNVAAAACLFRLISTIQSKQKVTKEASCEQQASNSNTDISTNLRLTSYSPADTTEPVFVDNLKVVLSEMQMDHINQVLAPTVCSQRSTSFNIDSNMNLIAHRSNQSLGSKSCSGLKLKMRSMASSVATKSRAFASDFGSSLRALFRRKLYTTNLNFLLIGIVIFAVSFCVVTPMTYLYTYVDRSLSPLCDAPQGGTNEPSSAQEKCLEATVSKATFAVSTLSLSTCAGVLLLGALSDRINCVALYLGAMTMVGACTMVIGFLEVTNETYPILLAIIGLFGLAYGASYSVYFVLLIQFNGLDQFSASLSIALMISGTANISGTPIGGLLFDMYGSYKPAFKLSACVLLGSIVLVVCLHLMLRFVLRVKWNMSLSAGAAMQEIAIANTSQSPALPSSAESTVAVTEQIHSAEVSRSRL